jgi:MoxR-like ATPase
LTPAPAPASLQARLARIAETLERTFLGKEETVRLLLVSAIAGEHAVLIGPPGTAKSALVRTFAQLVDARYFEYLLTRFTEPSEIFGPVDITAFREGRYERRTEGMISEAEVVFLDEVFKSNSAILNALLTLLNERRVTTGGRVIRSPLLAAFGASNEPPTDEALSAVYDRFLLRIRSGNLDAYHFHDLVARGLEQESSRARGEAITPVVQAEELAGLQRRFGDRASFSEGFLAAYKGLVFQIRAEGVSLSDRRVVKLLKLFSASAYLDGREAPDAGDLYILKHIWNSEDQAPLLEALVDPVLEAHGVPAQGRRGGGAVSVEGMAAEVERIGRVLAGEHAPSDVQLFSQLRALGEMKAALSGSARPGAVEVVRRIDELLESTFRGGPGGCRAKAGDLP